MLSTIEIENGLENVKETLYNTKIKISVVPVII